MENNKLQTMCEKTQDYLDSLDRQNLPTPAQIADDIIGIIATAYALRNAGMMNNKDNKWHIPDTLEPVQIAMILTALYPIKNISCLGDSSETDYDLLGIYQEDGPEKGIYSTSDRAFSRLCRQLHPGLTKQQLEEVRSQVSDRVERVPRCLERNLVPVNNGIFDFDTKQLLPFTPDKVFLTKCRVDYVPNAVSPVIHNQDDGTDWELEAWMKELSDDPGVPELFWEIMGAIIRPNVRWNKSAWFYNDRGENGKGTLCALMRNLCGPGNHAGIKLDDFSKEFLLEPLIRVSAIITDENDTDVYIDRVANLKAVITNDIIQVNRKFKKPIAYQFRGFMVQCINGMPKVRDKSDSFYRRQLFVPFRKCFTGVARTYIKDDYIHRKDVLEYALCRVLNMDYYKLSEPTACKEALAEYQEFNDPMCQFWNEHEDKFAWGLLPFGFLYDLYKAWLDRNAPKSSPVSKNRFISQLANLTVGSTVWEVPLRGPDGKYQQHRPNNRMDATEPLIMEYNLTRWSDLGYSGNNPTFRYRPRKLNTSYRGLIRKNPLQPQAIPVIQQQPGKRNEPGPQPEC